MVEELDDLDRTFFNISSTMSDVYRSTFGVWFSRLVAPLKPNQFDNATSRAKELGVRTLIIFGTTVAAFLAGTHIAITATILGVGSRLFKMAGFYLQKEGFTHIRGSASEESLANHEATFMVWKSNGFDFEGRVDWRNRLDRIVGSIKREQPDVIVLHDVDNHKLIEKLVTQLGDQYSHFYTHTGLDVWGNESGTVVITKCAVEKYSHNNFKANESEKNRGFELFEIKASPQDTTPCLRIVGTQLTAGEKAVEMRMDQIEEIVKKVSRVKGDMPTFLAASVNFDLRGEEGRFLNKYFYPNRDASPTYSPDVVNEWASKDSGMEEPRDSIFSFRRNTVEGKILPVIERNVSLVESRIVKGFEIDPATQMPDTKAGVSFNHAVLIKVRYK